MTFPKTAAVLTVILLATGCTEKRYMMPTEDSDVATIEFPVEPEVRELVYNEGYGYIYVYPNNEDCSERKQFRVSPGSETVKGFIPADEPITFSRSTDITFTGNLALFDYSGTSCFTMFTFTPESGEHYTVGIPKIDTGCQIEVTDKNGQHVPVTVRETKEALTGSGSWCEPL